MGQGKDQAPNAMLKTATFIFINPAVVMHTYFVHPLDRVDHGCKIKYPSLY